MLLSKWYNESGVPRNKIQTIIDDFTSFLKDFLPQIQNNVNIQLKNNVKSTVEINAMFNTITNPFKRLNTEQDLKL
jgi:archaellum component FlaC